MALIAVILTPSTIANPDLDLCYAVPNQIVAASAGTIESLGYGYDARQRIHIYLATKNLSSSQALVCGFLRTTTVLGNDLGGALVAVRDSDSGPLTIVYPEDANGTVDDLDEAET